MEIYMEILNAYICVYLQQTWSQIELVSNDNRPVGVAKWVECPLDSGRSGNPKIMGLSLEPVGLKHGQVKPMTLKLILVAF